MAKKICISRKRARRSFWYIFFSSCGHEKNKYIVSRELDLLHWVMVVNFFALYVYIYTFNNEKIRWELFQQFFLRYAWRKDRNCGRKTFLIRHLRQLWSCWLLYRFNSKCYITLKVSKWKNCISRFSSPSRRRVVNHFRNHFIHIEKSTH